MNASFLKLFIFKFIFYSQIFVEQRSNFTVVISTDGMFLNIFCAVIGKMNLYKIH